jgi:hypothetical protein
MTSIAFASLFLGLVLGNNMVGAIVEGPVAAVEFQLDGEAIARVGKPPWSTRVDLGADISPHELTARALDSSGTEVARARQWLNLPRGRAETQVVLERDDTGRAIAARLSSQSLVGSRPVAVTATLDGKTLSVDGTGRIALPPYDSATTHLLSAQVEFSEGVRSRADVVLGGASGEEAKSELTAIPVRVGRRREPEKAEELQDCFEKEGHPLRVVAFEEGPAQVLIVRDRGNGEASKVLGGNRYYNPSLARALNIEMRLARGDRMRLVWPVSKHYSDPRISSDLFDSSRDFTREFGGLHWLLTQVYRPGGNVLGQRFADAAAVAGLEAYESCARRAVVVVLGTPTDSSRMSPEAVRGYLEKVRVPLFVWSLVPPAAPDLERWGTVEDISSMDRLRKAFRALKKDLASQRVAWIEGKHLPQQVALTDKGRLLLELVD